MNSRNQNIGDLKNYLMVIFGMDWTRAKQQIRKLAEFIRSDRHVDVFKAVQFQLSLGILSHQVNDQNFSDPNFRFLNFANDDTSPQILFDVFQMAHDFRHNQSSITTGLRGQKTPNDFYYYMEYVKKNYVKNSGWGLF